MKRFQITRTAKRLIEHFAELVEAFSILRENQGITPAGKITGQGQMRAVGSDSVVLLENIDCCFRRIENDNTIS